jgi:hypothetical protein
MQIQIKNFLDRVPWGRFLLLWFLGVLMGASLLWLHYDFSEKILLPLALLIPAIGLGLLWATTLPKWQKAHCSFCMNRVSAKATRFDAGHQAWVLIYECEKCGHITEKTRGSVKAKQG